MKPTLWLIILIGLIYLFITNGHPFLGTIGLQSSVSQGGTSHVTRILPSTATPGTQIQVSLVTTVGSTADCPSAQASVCNDYYVIEEVLPPGTTPQATTPACTLAYNPTRILCLILQNAQSTTHTYTITTPPTNQALAFGGLYMFQGDTTPTLIGGATTLPLGPTTPGACTSTWTCTDWTPWTNTTCGSRTRSCTDTAACLTPTQTPSLTDNQGCTQNPTTTAPPTQISGTTWGWIVLGFILLYVLTRGKHK